MYQNLVNNNKMLNQFNGYQHQNPNATPFQRNQLINNNVHVLNNLNNFVQDYRKVKKQVTSTSTSQLESEKPYAQLYSSNKSLNNNKPSGINIIEEMLKPQKFDKKDINMNKDVASNFEARDKNQKNPNKQFQMLNLPYKNIMKDNIVKKSVDEIVVNKVVDGVLVNDLLVHTSIKAIDADTMRFNEEIEN